MTSPVDISPSQLEIVCNILRKYLLSNVRVWVFGSRAKWTTHDGSDLDLAVEGDQPIDHDTMTNLSIEFDDSDLPYTVDVVDLKAVNSKFKKIIDAQKIPVETNNTHWSKMPVSEVATAIIGGTPSRSVPDYWHGNIQWVTAKDIAKNNSRYLYKSQESITEMGVSKSSTKIMPKNTILITSRGTVGALTQLGKEMAFNQTCYALIPNERIVPDYLYYALKGTRSQMESLTYGTIFQTITTKSFKEWLMPIPTLDKQRIIAHILGTLDAKIDLNHKMNETLEVMARALFKSWFVDFDPVRAKMEGRWQPGESLPGLPSHLYDLFPDQLTDSELGDIPEVWTINVVKNCLNLTMGQSPPSKTYNDECKGLPFFQGSTDFGLRYPRKRKYCTAPTRIAHADDTLVSVRAPVGAINMAWEKCCIGRGVAALRHKTGSRSFTYYLAWSLQQDLKQYDQIGTVFGAITKNQLEMMPMVEPPRTLVNHFEAYVSTWDERIRRNTFESHVLTLQRNFLLSKLMSGKIRIQPEAWQ